MGDDETGSQVTRDAATALPFLAIILLTSPFIVVFASPALIAGIPLIVVYLFAVWAAIIITAFIIARRLAVTTEAEAESDHEAPTQ